MAERKKFIDVSIPILGQTIQVLGTPKELHNKTIKLDLSRKLRGKGVMMTLQIFNNEESLVTIPKKMEIVKSYLRRILRKRTDNVEDSFKVKCKDVRATMKPFLITRKRVSRAVRRNLRNTAREFLIEYVKEKTYLELSHEILNGVLQKELLPKLKKVYPLAFCDIRVFESKDLDKIDIQTVIDLDKKAQEADTEEVEAAIEEKVEAAAVTEAVEEAESETSEEVKEEKPKAKKTAKKTTKKEEEETEEVKEEEKE